MYINRYETYDVIGNNGLFGVIRRYVKFTYGGR
jgi:hypothetical protein